MLAEELCGCKAELLSGGLSGNKSAAIVTHLWGRQPVLIPYPVHEQICHYHWLFVTRKKLIFICLCHTYIILTFLV